jgi:hypothetical protein
VIVLNAVEQYSDVAPADAQKIAVLPRWMYVRAEEPGYLALGPQSVLYNVPGKPTFGDFLERIPLCGRRLERGKASADASERIASLGASFLDCHRVGAPNRRPDLAPFWIDSDRRERFCA